MCFLQRLRSFHVCSKLLATLYQSMVASTLFFTLVCWSGGTNGEQHGVNRLAKKVSRVMGPKLDSLEAVGERRVRDEIKTIPKNPSHPLHEELWLRESTFSQRLTLPRCRMEWFRYSFQTVQQCRNLMYMHTHTTNVSAYLA